MNTVFVDSPLSDDERRRRLGRTRFSIDFRSVRIDDVVAKAGAPNIDSESTMDGELVYRPPALDNTG